MRTSSKLAALGVSAALAIAPTSMAAAGTHGRSAASPGHSSTHSKPSTTTPEAFGKLCQSESKMHVKGEKGTAFSRCVSDMAKLADHETSNPHIACKNESKKHVKGEKGTAFSRCVVAANRLLKAERSKSS